MSNALAIAAITESLRALLETQAKKNVPAVGIADLDLGSTVATAAPPDKARSGTTNQINVFLYRVMPSAALRNMDPRGTRNGETATPPAALELDYLISVYGQGDKDRNAHALLGQVVRTLHDHPVLSGDDLDGAVDGADVHHQVERLRITPQPLSVDELSKLWSGFQTNFRLSVAYSVSVVLVESLRAGRAPLPVLERNLSTHPSVASPFPTLESIVFPASRTTALLGDAISLEGRNLDVPNAEVRLDHALFEDPMHLAPTAAAETGVAFVLPDDAPTWPAGTYRVSVVYDRGTTGERSTNELALMLAPDILDGMTPVMSSGTATFTMQIEPDVRPEQKAALLIAGREVVANPFTSATDTLTFEVTDAPSGTFHVRVRVAGVDSPLVDLESNTPSFFDDRKVVIP